MKNPPDDYYLHQRDDISKHIPNGNHLILDVGCGAGRLGFALKKEAKAEKVFGIELTQVAAQEASQVLDGVICADLDTFNVSDIYNRWQIQFFDIIIFADVLEHLKNPWNALSQFSTLLSPNAKVIISLPNVRHWSVWLPLLIKGRWDYQDAGVMDITHLRFFTRKTGIALIQKSGLELAYITPRLGPYAKVISKCSWGLFDDFLAGQFTLVAHKKSV